MKIVIDENIAFAEGAFSKFGKVLLINGRDISNKILVDADVLIVRSITKTNEQLLNDTNVKFVGTATIGTEHIDTDFLNKRNIFFTDAKGCNADSVAEYVLAALFRIAVRKKISFQGKTIGIIGVGNIGRRIVRYAEALGLKVLMNDPPKERERSSSNYISLDKALQADIITLHVPLNLSGIDKTFHLLDERRLNIIKKDAILINTSRGAVIDNKALHNTLDKKEFNVILDVWEGEPLIDVNLLEKVEIGTAHVAGYSFEGKLNGTKMIYDELCKFTNQSGGWNPPIPEIENFEIFLPSQGSIEKKLDFIFRQIYKIEQDDLLMRKMSDIDENFRGVYFDKLRHEYQVRREFNNYAVLSKNTEDHLSRILKTFRFNLKEKV